MPESYFMVLKFNNFESSVEELGHENTPSIKLISILFHNTLAAALLDTYTGEEMEMKGC